MSGKRQVLVFHNEQMDQYEGRGVEIAVRQVASNQCALTHLSRDEALDLYHRLGDYLMATKGDDA